ncbi:MAG: UbiA prenyltransferase family protein [Deltaproteobacteria bacterium]|nr:UbiA prenyltransferase family protein [Deltaproteobacteria bacterium]
MDRIKTYIRLFRFHQYVKNGFIWLPLFFSHRLSEVSVLKQTFWAFAAFCLASSCVYIINDIKDIDEDRQHPVKRFRPVASGLVKPAEALVYMSLLLFSSLAVGLLVHDREFLIIIVLYLTLNVAYSFFLKHLAIIDVVCIATGFALRVFAGGMAADVRVSHWIIVMTFLLALFLALGKRRDDLMISLNGQGIRKSLDGYTPEFVNLGMGSLFVTFMVFSLIPFAFAVRSLNPRGLVAKNKYVEFVTMITEAGPPHRRDYLPSGDRDSQRRVISTIIRDEYGIVDISDYAAGSWREYDQPLSGQVLRLQEKLLCYYMKPSVRTKDDLETEFRKLTDLTDRDLRYSCFLVKEQQAKIMGFIQDFDRHLVEMLTKANLFDLY